MAATASLGSGIFAAVSFVLISGLVLALLRHYLPLRTTPAYLLLPVFLALALPCYIVLLVPIDIASADGASSRGIWLPERTLLVIWRITYWLTFLLTWFVLPFLGEYVDAGDRDVHSRTMYSLRSNAQYIMIYLGTALVGLVYLIWQNGFHFESIKSLIMALAYAWGLILAIGLMGHGLVALPRRIFRNASVANRLRNLEIQAPRIKDKLSDATDELDQMEHTVMQLKQRKNGTSRDLQDWIDDLADSVNVSETIPGTASSIQAINIALPAVVTEGYLASVTRKLNRAKHKKARFVDEWNNLCDQAQEARTILNAASSRKLTFGRDRLGVHKLLARITFITPSMRYVLYATILPYTRIALAGFLALASALVVWSEVVRSFAPSMSIMSLTIVHHPSSDQGRVGFAGQLIAAAWLVYMDACTLYAITAVKVWGNRALVKRQTYAESACWYSLQVAKLTVPLSYNFITMLPQDVFKETSFFRFLGQLIILTPLGKGFSQFFPCLLLVPVLATLFNLYGKIKNVVGFGVLEDDNEENATGFGTGGWREGRSLIDHEIQSRSDGGRTVGLSSRPSADLERRAGTHFSGSSSPLPSREQRRPAVPAHVQEANRQFSAITNNSPAEDEDDSARHFYQDFTERVRNTFDTFDRPQWMKNFGSNLKTPEWMRNDPRDRNDGPSSGIARWFGGRPEEGRLQL